MPAQPCKGTSPQWHYTDATYREKAEKTHREYTANLTGTIDEKDFVVTDYQYISTPEATLPLSVKKSSPSGYHFSERNVNTAHTDRIVRSI